MTAPDLSADFRSPPFNSPEPEVSNRQSHDTPSTVKKMLHGSPGSRSANSNATSSTSANAFTRSPNPLRRLTARFSSSNTVSLRGGGLETPGSARRKMSLDKNASPRRQPSESGFKKKDKAVSISQKSPDIIDNPVAAYKEGLTRYLSQQDHATKGSSETLVRVLPPNASPLRTYSSPLAATSADDLPTTSTESNTTVRGGITPGLVAAGTPSYPFPRMHPGSFRLGPGSVMSSPHAQTPLLHSTGGQFASHFLLQEQVRSDPSTPTSNMTFQPAGHPATPPNFDYPSPNLYDLALMLTAEPGLDAWWNTVVQIMTQHFRAERVTLSVPADNTDLENVPWGQKATFNANEEDELSLGYMGRSSFAPQGSDRDSFPTPDVAAQRSERPMRPSMLSRHSFTSYEKQKESQDTHAGSAQSPLPMRPGSMLRSKSFYPMTKSEQTSSPHPALNKQALEEHDAEEGNQQVPSWEEPLFTGRDTKGRVLPMLQALDLEADPLIDHNGVARVIERGKVIALTRSYPYLNSFEEEKRKKESRNSWSNTSAESRKGLRKQANSDSSTQLSSLLESATAAQNSAKGKRQLPERSKIVDILASIDDGAPRAATPRYEEFEQTPPSPWSQSPAPSPAVRSDPSENPFFTDAVVDEESFNPGPSPHDYTSMQTPEAIGVDDSWTVLHIPLHHILLSKPTKSFKLNSAALGQRNSLRRPGLNTESPLSPEAYQDHPRPPVAILSILSPVIPYPSNLRHSLQHLGSHLATSFSLCSHYSMLETEVLGLDRKRPPTAGFGGVDLDGRPIQNPSTLGNNNYDALSSQYHSHLSVTDSMTSPSDYSTRSRSIAGSPAANTPSWEPKSSSLATERRPAVLSPAPNTSDGYFNTRPRNFSLGEDTAIDLTLARGGRINKGLPEQEQSHRRSGSIRQTADTPSILENQHAETSKHETDDKSSTRRSSKSSGDPASNPGEPDPAQETSEKPLRPSGYAGLGTSGQKHTLMHSYGADFAATFQSLPSSSSMVTKPTTSQSRTQPPTTAQFSMLPPSDRLKSFMLDSLPVHVFVALPVTGEIVWVNSRYMFYRGQTVSDLVADPWASLHPEDRDDYILAWSDSLRSGGSFDRTVRLRRFDGAYRWHQARAIPSKDKRGVVVQFIGSYMDIHDQHVAELKTVRQVEVEASEAKHRLLANLIPQIIFTATEKDGITFANDQWLVYTGQSSESTLGLGFMDYVHPDDLAKCRLPNVRLQSSHFSPTASVNRENDKAQMDPISPKQTPSILSRSSTSETTAIPDTQSGELTDLIKKGIIKVATDNDGRISYTTEVRLRSKSGEHRWHLVRCVEIDNIDFGNGVSSYFGSATDINDHKLLEAKLKEAMESKARFLSNMSHEIRTPLIGISGMVSFLQDTILNEEQRDYTNTIQTSAKSLLMIINDILDLSKVDAGMMKLKFEWFHTRALIEDVNELVSAMAIAKRLELNYIVEEDVPTWVKGDKVRIRQVLLNVIGNAIKFTSEGEVFSRCRVSTDESLDSDEDTIKLEFSIIDTGRGFTKEEAELIFKPFSQIDGSSTRQHGGSGLGLVISRQLVELHGGQMNGTAMPGKGSTFTFTARFGLPSSEDHPDAAGTPPLLPTVATPAADKHTQALRPFLLQQTLNGISNASPGSEMGTLSPALNSSASSDPSVRSSARTARSSISSINVGFAHFSEAAKASGQDLSQMRLQMPFEKPRLPGTPINEESEIPPRFRPPMYSILVICAQKHSREATTKHIEMTLPKDVPHQITAVETVFDAEKLIGGHESVTFTHVVLNLGSAEEVIGVVDSIIESSGGRTSVLILSDSVQRQSVLKLASDPAHQQLINEKRMTFVYKPVKPSRFAVIFDPGNERDLSVDLNRSSAAQMVDIQKQNYIDVEKRIGNKGYKVMLVEDNPVNQKVLVRYLKKVGIEAEIAADGVECTEKVFSHDPGYYSLILCDLHMPRKDGYQACREIRAWEAKEGHPRLPIIALSANVMSDVQEKCVAAGFSDYVTKPVDFVDLSTAMSKFI
ncbi:two-component system, sensor histidine kinase and response regulator [Microdochium nivale]|nr:two-component system, sensor histidine kinase and response regulator [Microdochium nivale]